jgi:hypothetical protein
LAMTHWHGRNINAHPTHGFSRIAQAEE